MRGEQHWRLELDIGRDHTIAVKNQQPFCQAIASSHTEDPCLTQICVSGTVGGPLLTQKSPTCVYISQKLWCWDPR